MRITILPLVFLLSAIIFLTSCNVYAQDNDIGYSQLHPAHPLYFLKSIREEFEKYFAKVPKVKFMRSLEFATRRLREVKSLITVERQDLVEPNLERYWFYISSLPDKDLEDNELRETIEDTLVIHIKTLTKIYPQLSNLRAKMSIRSVLNRLTQRADLPDYAKLSVCEFLAIEATSSAQLNEAERAILKERSQTCFNSF